MAVNIPQLLHVIYAYLLSVIGSLHISCIKDWNFQLIKYSDN